MWPLVSSGMGSAFDRIWKDVEHEVERSLHFALLHCPSEADARGPEPSCGVIGRLWCSSRAVVLHHLLPHDKSIFGRMKDPLYLCLYALTMIPVHGLRGLLYSVLLLMLAFPGPVDEFQIINFILLLKSCQFLSSGFIQMAVGAFKYYTCAGLVDPVAVGECILVRGPGAGESRGLLIDYLVSILLVWVAMGLLMVAQRVVTDPLSQRMEEGEVIDRDALKAHGRLYNLLRYDLKCFVLSLFLLAIATICSCDEVLWGNASWHQFINHPQLCANVFWCLCLYSISTLPFAIFLIPPLFTILTHSNPTGYNWNGACVAWTVPPCEISEQDSEDKDGEGAEHSPISFTYAASVVTKLVQHLELGREWRGGRVPGSYRLGDIHRGLWSKVHSKWKRRIVRTRSLTRSWRSSTSGPAGECLLSDTPTNEPNVWLDGLVAAGHKARLGVEAIDKAAREGSYQFGDVTRGLWEHLRREQLTGACPAARWLAVGAPQLRVAIPAAVAAPPCGEQTFFNIDVEVVSGRAATEHGLLPWRARRSFSEFGRLAQCLGPRSLMYQAAPFPRRFLRRCQGRRLEERRLGLEAWLRQVVLEQQGEVAWSTLLHDFLQPIPGESRSTLKIKTGASASSASGHGRRESITGLPSVLEEEADKEEGTTISLDEFLGQSSALAWSNGQTHSAPVAGLGFLAGAGAGASCSQAGSAQRRASGGEGVSREETPRVPRMEHLASFLEPTESAADASASTARLAGHSPLAPNALRFLGAPASSPRRGADAV